MTRDELLKLADRVEALTGPDREVDAEIELAFMPDRRSADPTVPLLAYTASLDAALTLVPEGWAWIAGHGRKPMAYVHNGQSAFAGIGTRPNPARRWFEVSAATPAIALVGCALRAHASFLGE